MSTKTKKLVKKTIESAMENNMGSGLRFNEGKPRFDLVQADAHRDMVKVLTAGANKYADRNWEKGMNWTTVIASMKRHIAAIEAGEDYDQETGLLHAAHVQCNAHFLNAYYYLYPQGDDRPKKWKNTPKIGLDIDEVLADWVTAWRDEFDIKDVPTSWFFDRNIKDRFEELRPSGKLDELYLNIKPLIKPSDIPFEPHCYITSRPVDTKISEQWLDKNGFPSKPVYTVGIRQSKVEVAKEAGVEIFIDDSYDNFVTLNNNGIFCYLYDAPHNQRYDVGHMRIKTLKDIPFHN
jgi:5'(3')-deoxyribonucleotidase